MKGRSVLRSLLQNTTSRQSGLLFGAQLFNAVLGVGITIANTRLLSVDDFGIFSFVTSTVLFIGWFFDFGIFSAGSRLMAVVPDSPDRKNERPLAGALILLAAIVSVLFALCIILTSLFIDRIFPNHIGELLFLLAPLLMLFPFQGMLLLLFRGSNEIGKLAFHTVLPRVLYCCGVGIAVAVGGFTLWTSLLLNFGTLTAAVLIVAAITRPVFKGVGAQIRQILRVTREYGIHLYSGTLVDILTTGSDKLVISFVLGATSVGFYSVAQTIVMPISMLSRSIGASAFKRFASLDRIPRNIAFTNSVWIVGLAVIILAGNQWLIRIVFSEKYDVVSGIVPVLAISMVFNGWNQIYHSYFSARGLGITMRNISISTSAVNVVADIALIPLIGMMGAAIADLMTCVFDYGLNRYYYRQYCRDGAVSPNHGIMPEVKKNV